MENLNSLRRMNFAKESEVFINAFMNQTPLFNVAPAFPTNNGSRHKYGKIINIPTPTERNFAGGYRTENIKKRLEVMELKPVSYKDAIHKDIVDELDTASLAQMIKDNEVSIGNETAKVFEAREYADYLAFATANHRFNFYGTNLGAKLFDGGKTSTTNTLYTILFVSWKKDKIDIRFNPKMNPNVKDGISIFKKDLVANGANVHLDSYTESSVVYKRYGKEILYDTSIDTLLNDPRMISAIVNVDITVSASDLTTLIENALQACYPEEGEVTTMFYHNDLATLINSIKEDKLQTVVGDNAFRTKYNTFNDAVLIKSRQMLSGQNTITVPAS